MWLKKKNKFGARRTSANFNGEVIHCPSALEASVASMLELMRLSGEAEDLRYQHGVDLGLGVRWKVDFSYFSTITHERIWVEAKGKWDAVASLKKRMWKTGGGAGRLEIWQGSYRAPKCTEVIYPKGHQTSNIDESSQSNQKVIPEPQGVDGNEL